MKTLDKKFWRAAWLVNISMHEPSLAPRLLGDRSSRVPPTQQHRPHPYVSFPSLFLTCILYNKTVIVTVALSVSSVYCSSELSIPRRVLWEPPNLSLSWLAEA